VVEVGHDDRGPKIGCSMKLVDQADGTDLDPQVGNRRRNAAQGFRFMLLSCGWDVSIQMYSG
jgi:hypothetical protein